MSTDLRTLLADAFPMMNVDAVTAVVVEWLRAQADHRVKMANSEDVSTVRTLLLVKADTLTNLANELAPALSDTQETDR